MIVCSNCGTKLDDNAAFCSSCGTKVEKKAVLFCSNCGSPVKEGAMFCTACGHKINETSESVAEEAAACDIIEEITAEAAAEPVAETEKNEIDVCSDCGAPADKAIACDICEDSAVTTVMCRNSDDVSVTPMNVKKVGGISIFNAERLSEIKNNVKFAFDKISGKISKKAAVIGASCVALVLVAAILLSVFVGKGKTNSYVTYLKDGQIYYAQTDKIEPIKLTEQFNCSYDKYENLIFDSSSVCLSNDGKMIFYIDGSDNSLYYRYVNDTKKAPVKIDLNVSEYSVSKSGKTVIYFKNTDDSDLYTVFRYDFEEKEQIADNVQSFVLSDDGETLVYIDEEKGLYTVSPDNGKTTVDSDVSEIFHVNGNSDIYYSKYDSELKNSSLYKKAMGGSTQEIASDICSVIKVYDSGELYFTKPGIEEVTLLDYVDDDMKEKDGAISDTEPEAPDSPNNGKYSSYDAYLEAYNKYKEKYEQYRDSWYEWRDKKYRDALRSLLEAGTVAVDSEALYYYDGNEEKLITNNMINNGLYDCDYFNDTPIIAYSLYDTDVTSTAKLSELDVSDLYTTYNSVRENVESTISTSVKSNIAVKSNAHSLEQAGALDFIFTSDGKTVYYSIKESNEDAVCDVYKASISGDSVADVSLYENDVYDYGKQLTNDNEFIYYKVDTDTYLQALYIDREKTDDANYYIGTGENTRYDENTGIYLYKDDMGVFKMYKDGKISVISDEINYLSDYNVTSDGAVVYLNKSSYDSETGELYIYKNGKTKKIDEGVKLILSALS